MRGRARADLRRPVPPGEVERSRAAAAAELRVASAPPSAHRPEPRWPCSSIPPIDILGGKAVRLEQGDFERRTEYDADPLDAARRWVDAGRTALARGRPRRRPRAARPVNLEHLSGSRPTRRARSSTAAACAAPSRSPSGARRRRRPGRARHGGLRGRRMSWTAMVAARRRARRGRASTCATAWSRPRMAGPDDRASPRPEAVDGAAPARGAGDSSTPTWTATARCEGPDLNVASAADRSAQGSAGRLFRRHRHRSRTSERWPRPCRSRGRDRRQGAVRGPDSPSRGRQRSGGRPMSVLKRVIPCLDVDKGRVVKGTNFVGLRDAGDPVELAERYDAEGADELVFLDITASHEQRDTIVRLARRTADNVFIPFTIGGGIRSREDAQAVLDAGADKVSVNSAAVRAARADRGARRDVRRAVRRARDRREAHSGRRVRGVSQRRPGGDRQRRGRVGARGRRARGGGDPAHEHGPRRHRRTATTSSSRARSPTPSTSP